VSWNAAASGNPPVCGNSPNRGLLPTQNSNSDYSIREALLALDLVRIFFELLDQPL
jgi:hypothetical protein